MYSYRSILPRDFNQSADKENYNMNLKMERKNLRQLDNSAESVTLFETESYYRFCQLHYIMHVAYKKN